MTPGERKLMEAEIAAAVQAAVTAAVPAAIAAALAPVRKELGELHTTDRKHSGVHRDIAADVRQSQSNIKAGVDETVDALARRDHQIVGALNEVRDELVRNRVAYPAAIAPAAGDAKDAKTQATEAATQARNVGIDMTLVKKDAARAVAWWRHPAVVFFFFEALDWLSKHASSLVH